MAVSHLSPPGPEPGAGWPARFTHEPLDSWTDGQPRRIAISRVLATLAAVAVVAAIFFVAHVATSTP